jgi:cell wall-associated NlpC family hydrolase
MPNRLRSRLLALALVAGSFACATAAPSLSEAAPHPSTVRAQRTQIPLRLPVEKRRRHRQKHGRARKRTLGERAARIARRAVGVPYRWGGTSPSGGFDCSGLVYWAYRHVGVALPHSSYALAQVGRPVRRSRLRPGDLLFFYGFGHVGLYVGRGRMVHAPHTGRRVEVVRLGRSRYGSALIGARRISHR